MDPIPALSGETIFLARLRREDLPEITRHFSNLELTTYLGSWGRAYSLEDEQAWYDAISRVRADEVHFGIYERSSGRIVGSTGLREIDHRHGTATFGIGIFDSQDWGVGFGSQATRLMVAYGMYHLNLWNIELRVFAFNERAIQAYKKVGFREIGRRTGRIVLGGERFDDVYMEITRDEVDTRALRAQLRQLPADPK